MTTSKKGFWLHAYHNPLAGLYTFSSGMSLSDVLGDGDHALLIADQSRKLRVMRGTAIVSEKNLLGDPVAMASYYMDHASPQRPIVAVASGPYLFLYKNMRPHYKFTLPPVGVSSRETKVWRKLHHGRIEYRAAIEELEQIREDGEGLGLRSRQLIAVAEGEGYRHRDGENNDDDDGRDGATGMEAVTRFVSEHSSEDGESRESNVVTCMGTLRKEGRGAAGSGGTSMGGKNIEGTTEGMGGEQAIGCLVVGTETGMILILHPSGASVMAKAALPSAPAFLAIVGSFDVDYRIMVACRDQKVYIIKNGELTRAVIEVEDPVCGLVATERSVYVATTGNAIHEYHVKGKKHHTLYLPSPVTSMELLSMQSSRNTKAVVLGLQNQELRVYNENMLVDQNMLDDVPVGMQFGTYGRESNVLAIVYRGGGLAIRMVRRGANLEEGQVQGGPPPEQDTPLTIPRTTRLALEQARREQRYGVEMHRAFQRDLCQLRLRAAKGFVRILTDGMGPTSYGGGMTVRMVPTVHGLGPRFRVRIETENTGSQTVHGAYMQVRENDDLYDITPRVMDLPALVPGLSYVREIQVETLHPEEPPGELLLVLGAARMSTPVMTVQLDMPEPDMLLSTMG
eukprot:gb/GECH01013677.1/.p1 GENE.gb/GECH01013677.1/~~gb/GECH01013677.1/.p1  ORF type:complete len:624 (+),score=115.66 gb/GECH01013677.1/:1-1872(+)